MNSTPTFTALLDAAQTALRAHDRRNGGRQMALQTALEPETAAVAHPRRVDRDLDLVAALRRRDPIAAERLVTTYGDRAYRLAASITGNGQDAEEVVQDVFWTVIRKIDGFRGESAFGSWLYRIVANAAYQKLRGRSRRRELSWEVVMPVFDDQDRHSRVRMIRATVETSPLPHGKLAPSGYVQSVLAVVLSERIDHRAMRCRRRSRTMSVWNSTAPTWARNVTNSR